jgi:hypothetical protein
MNALHVWNYAQALAFLFPARALRPADDYQLQHLPDGGRSSHDALASVLWNYVAAADGRGHAHELYRSGSSRDDITSGQGPGQEDVGLRLAVL